MDKILVHGGISAIYTGYKLIHQYQLIFWYAVNNIMRVFVAFQKMGYYHVVRIVVLTVVQQLFKQVKIVVVNIKINRSEFAKRGNNGVVNDLFVRTKFIEQQEDL